jgi:acetoin utilization deacetylase AcuC-like enzyme
MTKLPVFYTPRQSADSGAFSPSAAKPAQLVASWLASGLPVDVRDFAPVTVEDLCRAHGRQHVLDVLKSRKQNGFGNFSPEVAATLPYTSGSLLAAARYAVAHPELPSPCSPTSGFHHAGPNNVAGFCTFNGLMVAALALLADGTCRKGGIVDFDEHYGNGTDEILARLPKKLRRCVKHVTAGQSFNAASQAEDFLGRYVPETVAWMADCDVVLYQAGQDPHVDDPLGGWLTTEQLAERDALVLQGFRRAGVPVAWNLAGGYRKEADGSIPKVLAGHTNTARAALVAAGAL